MVGGSFKIGIGTMISHVLTGGEVKRRAVSMHYPRFPGPTMEQGLDGWGFPDPLVVTGSDRLRIMATWFGGLNSVDSALLFRIIELNSEKS